MKTTLTTPPPSILVKQNDELSTQNNTLHFPVCYGLQDEYLNLNILVATSASVGESLALSRILFFFLSVQRSRSSLQLRCSSPVISPTQPHSSWSQLELQHPIAIQRVFTSIATLNLDITYSQTAVG